MRVEKIFNIYRPFHLLSLDIVAGVVVCALFFANTFTIPIHMNVLIVLAITVWIIYTADHLFDAHAIQRTASTERHRFHQRHQRWLIIGVVIAAATNGVLLFTLDGPVMEWGFALLGIVAIYLLAQKFMIFVKEFLAAGLYVAGILLPSFALMSVTFDRFSVLLIGQFFLIAYINLILFSWFDQYHDRKDGMHSLVTRIGSVQTVGFIMLLFCGSMGLIAYQFFLETPFGQIMVLFLLMNGMLLLLFVFRNWFNINDRFRILGDLVFLFPAFLLM